MHGVRTLKEFPLEQRRTWVIALMIECPLGEALDGCPAAGVRGLPLAEVVELVGELREEDLNRIIRHHRQCLDTRERARDGGVEVHRSGS